MRWNGVGLTDPGRVRLNNQDSFLINNHLQLFSVADGMGGHAGGEIASQIAMEVTEAYYEEFQKEFNYAKLSSIDLHGERAINKASKAIFNRSLESPELQGMGTTETLLYIHDDIGFCAHVGDSRLYLFRAGFLYQLSNDHSLVSEQIRAGKLTAEEAQTHKLRNIITRCVGYKEEEVVDTFHFKLESSDIFLLCSDGLHGKIRDHDIAEVFIKKPAHPEKELIEMANAAGGEDNITAVVVRSKDKEKTK